jgi:hypothetical protein
MNRFDLDKVDVYINSLSKDRLQKIKENASNNLCHSGYSLTIRTKLKYLHMFAAILDNNLEILEYLIFGKKVEIRQIEIAFAFACFHNSLNVLDYLETIFNFENNKHILRSTLRDKTHANYELVKYLLEHMTKLTNNTMRYITRYGKLDLVTRALEIRKKKYKFDITCAVESGNMELIMHVANLQPKITKIDMECCMRTCAKHGYIEIAKYITTKYQYDFRPKAKFYALESMKTGQIDFLKFLSDSGGDIIDNKTNIWANAIRSKSIDMCKFLIESGAKIGNGNSNGLSEACHEGLLDIVKYFVSLKPNLSQIFEALDRFHVKHNFQTKRELHNRKNAPCKIFIRKVLIKMLIQTQNKSNAKLLEEILATAQKYNYQDIINVLTY